MSVQTVMAGDLRVRDTLLFKRVPRRWTVMRVEPITAQTVRVLAGLPNARPCYFSFRRTTRLNVERTNKVKETA